MATIEEIIGLEGDSRRSSQEVQRLLQEIRQEMQDAQQADRQTLKNIETTGKTGLKALKTRKDFLLAKRAMPELSFKDFLLNDKTSAEYMRQGVKEIVRGKQPGITLKETLGLSNPTKTLSDMQAVVDKAKSSSMYQFPLMQSKDIQSPVLENLRDSSSNLSPNLSNVSASLDYSGATTSKGVNPSFSIRTEQAPVNIPIESVPQGTIPVPMIEEVAVTPTSAANASTASSTLGTAGTALGTVSALRDLTAKGATPTSVLDTAGSAMQLTGFGAVPGTILKGISRFLKGTTRNN